MRRPGVLLLEWIVVLMLAVAASLIYSSEFGRSELNALASTILLGVALAAVVPLLVGVSAINALWRSKRLSAARGATGALTFVKSGSLAIDVKKFCRVMEKPTVEVPFHGSVLATQDGIEIWGGAAISPKRILTIPSSDVKKTSIVRGSIGLQSGQFLEFDSRVEGVGFKMQLVGGGLMGLFSPKAHLVSRIVDAWRNSSTAAGASDT